MPTNPLWGLVPYKPVPLIHDGSWNQRVLGVTEDGLELTVPCLPYEWWMDKEGSVVPVVISNNRCMPPQMAKTREDHEAAKSYEVRYQEQIRSQCRAANWVRLDDELEYVPPKVDEDGIVTPQPPRERKPGALARLQAEMEKRRARAAERGKKYEDMATSNNELIARAIVDGNKTLIEELGVKTERRR